MMNYIYPAITIVIMTIISFIFNSTEEETWFFVIIALLAHILKNIMDIHDEVKKDER